MTQTVRICALYPERLNLYADRGNLIVLGHRCAARGIDCTVTAVSIDEPLPAADLYYLGGGQDHDQRRCADDLSGKADDLRGAVDDGAFVVGVCGGFQLLGHSYDPGGAPMAGIGLVDAHTEAGDDRLVGDAAVAVDLGDGPRLLVGFENHRGRTVLGPNERALGRVVSGHGNNGWDGTEGVLAGRVIGTYLHGPLLARNAWLADWLIAGIVGADALDGLDDGLEDLVHRSARRRAGC